MTEERYTSQAATENHVEAIRAVDSASDVTAHSGYEVPVVQVEEKEAVEKPAKKARKEPSKVEEKAEEVPSEEE